MALRPETPMYSLEGCEVIGGTPLAIHVETKAGVKVWIPRGLIGSINYGNSGEHGTTVRMSVWIAKRKGLI